MLNLTKDQMLAVAAGTGWEQEGPDPNDIPTVTVTGSAGDGSHYGYDYPSYNEWSAEQANYETGGGIFGFFGSGGASASGEVDGKLGNSYEDYTDDVCNSCHEVVDSYK